MLTHSVTLLSNASADSASCAWPGGRGHISIVGTWAGTSAQLEYLAADGATWLAVKVMATDGTQTAVALTADGGFVFELPPTRIRVNFTGGTPSAMYAQATRIPQ